MTRAAARSLDVVEPSTAVTMESAACEIQYALVDRYVELDAARLLVESAAIQHDDGGDALLASLAALAAATSAAESATGDAIQFHGGIGFTFEHPVHLRSRWRWREQPVFKWLAGATAVVVAPALPLLLLVAATQRPQRSRQVWVCTLAAAWAAAGRNAAPCLHRRPGHSTIPTG